MHPKYPRVFSPIKLGPVEIPNRFYFSPHGVALTVGTKPSDDFVAYKTARVKGGGCGLVVVSMTVHDRGRAFQPCPYPPDSVPAFRVLADSVHKAGGKIFSELWYWWGMTGHWQPYSPPAPSLSASAAQFGLNERTVFATHEMNKDEIRRMTDVLRQSCRNLREAGYDGVMFHASHGGMVEQFISPYFNNRTDEYGGSLDNRLRFLFESLKAAREEIGDKMALGIRFNCDEMVSGGYTTTDARDILKRICDSGLIDYVDLDVAIEPNQLEYGMPPVFQDIQVYRPFVEAIRSAAGELPVMSVLGRVATMADAEAALVAGVCDMVGAARSLIAEPELVKNARDGKEDLNRTCIACNWCLAALGDGAQGCAINPASFRERQWGVETFTPAARKQKVVVVGGGPGGLEAARVAALRGHDVTLYEARDKLGGAFALWAGLPGREFFQKATDWWERDLKRLGVKIHRGAQADAATVLAEKPDAVVVATGALYSKTGRSSTLDQDIPGHNQSFVYRPEDILLGKARPTGKVVLLDGEGLHASFGVAEVLGKGGAQVEYVTPALGPMAPRIFDSQESRFIMKRLQEAGVKLTYGTYIKSIGNRTLTIYDIYGGQERSIDGVDAVVLATGRVPENGLAKALEGKVAQLYLIGDALSPRILASAVYEGQMFARFIGEPNAPKSVADAYFRPVPPEAYPVPADVPRSAA